MKKWLIVLVSVLLISGLLLSCAPAEEEPTPPLATPGQQEEEEEEEPTPPGPPTGEVPLTPTPVTPLNPVFGGEFVTASPLGPGGFDMHDRPSYAGPVLTALYNNLVQLNPVYRDAVASNLIGDLAESWGISADEKTLTFHLRRGVKWHDGEDFDADDVIYSIEKWMDKTTGSRVAGYYPAYESVEKVDQYTVNIHLQYPAAAFLVQLANPYAVILPEHNAGADEKSTDFLVGTGPYMFGEYVPGAYWLSVRNPNYFKKDALGNQLPYLDGVRTYFGVNTVDAFLGGRLDMSMPGIYAVGDIERLRNEAPADTLWHLDRAEFPVAIWFNFDFEPFKDVRVRKAFTLLWDIDQIHLAWTGTEETGFPGGFLFPPSWRLPEDEIAQMVGWNLTWEERVAQAKQLMADAGYANGFTVRALFQQREAREAAAFPIYADKLREINVDMQIHGLTSGEFWARAMKGDWDIYSGVIFAFIADPDAFAPYLMTDSGSNYANYSNPDIDALWNQQAGELDPYQRWLIVQDIERAVIEDAPMLPGVFTGGYRLRRGWVKNWRSTASIYGSNVKFEDVWLER